MRDIMNIVESITQPAFSDAFAHWFSGSKVFNEEPADPLVVHHFTHMDFTRFDHEWVTKTFKRRDPEGIDRIGYWFTDNPNARYGPKRMDCFLRILKPFWMDDGHLGPGKDCAWTQLDRMCKAEGGASKLRAKLQAQGHDGIIMTSTLLDGFRQSVFVAFDGKQIKSVENRGNYDPDSDDILD